MKYSFFCEFSIQIFMYMGIEHYLVCWIWCGSSLFVWIEGVLLSEIWSSDCKFEKLSIYRVVWHCEVWFEILISVVCDKIKYKCVMRLRNRSYHVNVKNWFFIWSCLSVRCFVVLKYFFQPFKRFWYTFPGRCLGGLFSLRWTGGRVPFVGNFRHIFGIVWGLKLRL